MPDKSGTSDRLRAVLASLETLAGASLDTLRFRWEAFPLGYAPLAGLAADPADHYHRRLKTAADRLFDPAVQPDAAQQRPGLHAGHRGRGPVGPDTPLPTGKKHSGGSASRQGGAGFSAGRPSAPAAMPDQDIRSTLPREAPQDQVPDTVARILSRIAGHAQSASEAPVSERATDLKEDPGPAGAPRRRPAGTRLAAEDWISHAGKTMRLDSVRSAAGSGGKDPDAVRRGAPDRQQPKAVTKQGIPFKPHRLGPSDSDIPAALGKTSMSRSGLTAPLKLDKTLSADRLGELAYGGESVPIQHSGVRNPRPVDVLSRFPEKHSSRGENLIRPRRSTDPAPAEIREIGMPGARSSLLARLVSQWQHADKGPAQPAPRDLTPPQADAVPLPLEPSPSQWPLSGVSDMDFVRRLENVLLSESRRHGIVVEDQ